MKKILVYGDSNTWGSRAFGGRYQFDDQWPNVLQKLLGNDCHVVQEGLCARIAGDYDKVNPHRNGKPGFEIALRSACPVDVVIVALGTNDLKEKYNRSAEQIFEDLLSYKKRTLKYAKEDEDMTNKNPKILYLRIAEYLPSVYFDARKDKHKEVNALFDNNDESVIKLEGLELSEDGVHYSKNDHKIVAKKVFDKLKELKA